MPALRLSEFKALVREQFYMLLIDEDASLAAISSMLPPDTAVRSKALGLIKEILSARGQLTAADTERLERVAKVFNVRAESDPFRNLVALPSVRDEGFVKAS